MKVFFRFIYIEINNSILAALTEKDEDIGKKKFVQFENEAGNESELPIINDDSLDKENQVIQEKSFLILKLSFREMINNLLKHQMMRKKLKQY
jgi:hypothetical protein